MTNPIQNEAKTKELKHEKSFGFKGADTNDGPSTSINDPDTMLSMIVLLLACLMLAALANVFV
jgi:hypothetical protein